MTDRYLPVVFDTETEQFRIEDREHGDYVTASMFRERRIWSHYCPNSNRNIRYSKHVAACTGCGEIRPEAKGAAVHEEQRTD